MSRSKMTWPQTNDPENCSTELHFLAETFEEKVDQDSRFIVFLVGMSNPRYVFDFLDIAPPKTELHIFEPDPSNYERVFDAVSGGATPKPGQKVFCNAMGLSSSSGILTFSPETQLLCHTGSLKIRVDSIDEYCATRKLKRVDFLRLDTGGWEVPILKGAKKISLSRILFSYGMDWKVMGRKIGDIFIHFREMLVTISELLHNGTLQTKLKPIDTWMSSWFVVEIKDPPPAIPIHPPNPFSGLPVVSPLSLVFQNRSSLFQKAGP